MPLLEEARQPIGKAPQEARVVYTIALTVLAFVIGYIAVVDGRRPPLLGWADLGIHELGHRLFFWAPPVVTAMMGNGTQALVPFLFALYFACRPWFPIGKLHGRDWAACGLCLAWTAVCLQDASPYIADAPYQRLPLLHPGGIHDWAFILGPEHFNAYGQAQQIANVVWDVAWGFWLVGLGICLLACLNAVGFVKLSSGRPLAATTEAPPLPPAYNPQGVPAPAEGEAPPSFRAHPR